MSSSIVVNVYLEAVGIDPPPKQGAIKFNYALDNGRSDKWVHVMGNGDIYAGNADNKQTTLTFVLKTKQLSWNGANYTATLAPNQSQPNGAAEMILISTDTTKSPSARWPAQDQRFAEFKVPDGTTAPFGDALQVKFDRASGSEDVFQYSVAVNVKDSQQIFVGTVRDDPQIKDRGVPTAPNAYEWLAVTLAFLAGLVVAYVGIRLMQRQAAMRPK